VLKRAGLSRPPRPAKEPANRYEWPCPGDLLHMDVSRHARFERPGHALTGDRSQHPRRWMAAERRVGYDFAHALVDDHSRLAYVELHRDERAQTVTGFLERALRAFEQQGILAKRLMTDNAWSYVRNRSLRQLLAARGIKHLTIQPYRPRTNGKVERFHQTMEREWAKGVLYRSHRERSAALPHWLEHYNRRRPHSSLGGPTSTQPRSQRLWVAQLGAAAPDLRALPAQGGVRERLQRLVQAAQLVDQGGEVLARVQATVEPAHLVRQLVEPLEQRVELAVSDFLVVHGLILGTGPGELIGGTDHDRVRAELSEQPLSRTSARLHRVEQARSP
jgi:transposase InsO family protein